MSSHKGLTGRVLVVPTSLAQSLAAGYTGRDANIVSWQPTRTCHETKENTMIKLLVERDRPPTFNLADDKKAARHARILVNAIAELAGRFHWVCTFATEEKLFTVIAVDDESVYDEWVKKTNAYTAGLKLRRIVRVLDPSLAE